MLREVVTGFARIVVTTEGLSNGEGPDGCDVGVPQEDPQPIHIGRPRRVTHRSPVWGKSDLLVGTGTLEPRGGCRSRRSYRRPGCYWLWRVSCDAGFGSASAADSESPAAEVGTVGRVAWAAVRCDQAAREPVSKNRTCCGQ